MSVHLSKELREKYKKRNVPVVVGDTVKVLRGQFKTKRGKVSRVDYQRTRVYVEGIDVVKKDGNKVPFSLDPSNIMITSLKLEDKKRIASLERK
jgi:large subunit ribosomal protein L24